MNATDILSHEHRAIELVLDTMDKAANRLENSQELDLSILDDCLDFVTGFADACHHAKEETALFPLLQERGMTKNGGPIGVMLHEHEEGRSLIKEIKENLTKFKANDESARTPLVQAIRCYTTLLRSHIMKEDQVLFIAASAALSDEDNKRLIQDFDEIEEKKIGPGVHEEYHKMLDELAERCKNL